MEIHLRPHKKIYSNDSNSRLSRELKADIFGDSCGSRESCGMGNKIGMTHVIGMGQETMSAAVSGTGNSNNDTKLYPQIYLLYK